VTDVDDAEERALDGEPIILGRPSTSPDDVHAMAVVAGIVTEVGGSTSHAAVVSREFDVPCIVGCGKGVVSDLAGRTVTLDATTGAIYDGAIATVVPVTEDTSDLAKLADWARERGATGTSLTAMLEQTRAVGAPQ
jgi:pyruvate,orthophosphate dikinase